MKHEAFIIQNITEYGYLVAYCQQIGCMVDDCPYNEQTKDDYFYLVRYKFPKALFLYEKEICAKIADKISLPKFYFDQNGNVCREKNGE